MTSPTHEPRTLNSAPLVPQEKGIHYRCHPANVDVLQAASIDVATLANNHLLDWGAAGPLSISVRLKLDSS